MCSPLYIPHTPLRTSSELGNPKRAVKRLPPRADMGDRNLPAEAAGLRAAYAHSLIASDETEASRTVARESRETSMDVFRRHMRRVVKEDGSVVLDVTGVLSKACFDEWAELHGRTHTMDDPPRTFQRILTGFVSPYCALVSLAGDGIVDAANSTTRANPLTFSQIGGTDGRRPFGEDEERALLRELRVKRVWYAAAHMHTRANL